MTAEAFGIKDTSEDIPYETDRIVGNWAQTFECRPERFYFPDSEEQVTEVLLSQ